MQRFLRKVVVAVVLVLVASTLTATANAQTVGERGKNRGGEGPTHLVLTYSCVPQNRVAFREFMATKGVDQFEKWKKEGIVKNYLILFSTFVNEYVIPQLKIWVKSGIMPSYQIHMNQNPTNAPWHSLLLFEYDGLRGIALRDMVKQSARDKDLKDDPGYSQYSLIKQTIRKELEPTTFVAILPKN